MLVLSIAKKKSRVSSTCRLVFFFSRYTSFSLCSVKSFKLLTLKFRREITSPRIAHPIDTTFLRSSSSSRRVKRFIRSHSIVPTKVSKRLFFHNNNEKFREKYANLNPTMMLHTVLFGSTTKTLLFQKIKTIFEHFSKSQRFSLSPHLWICAYL